MSTTYHHTQRAPLCILLYALAVVQFGIGLYAWPDVVMRWIMWPVSLLVLLLAASFHHLTVRDDGERLRIAFGPVPLFRRSVAYRDIESVTIGRTTILDGWGIHVSLRGGWVWNIWGRDCVELRLRRGILRVGTDDAANLAQFIRSRLPAS